MEPAFTNASFFTKVSDSYQQIWELRDRRVDDYILMSSPLYVIMLCCFYVVFSLYVGPRIMKNRKPYNVKPIIFVYNLIMVGVNGYLHIIGWMLAWFEYKWVCEPVDTSTTPEALRITRIVHFYFILKLLDWVDTLFFLLRKKFEHVSVLHVYHHFCMPINIWPIVRFSPGGHTTFLGLINTFVHTIMHTYYAVSALGPKWQKYLWWKRYLTMLQLVQFILIGIHFSYSLWLDCGFPRKSLYFYFPQLLVIIALFTNFYVKAYKQKQK